MVSKVREAVREAGASLLGALAVSTILTASIALPLAVRAVDASAGPDGIEDAIAMDDTRFPSPVHLGTEQAEILARGDDQENELDNSADAEVAGATVTAATPRPSPDGDERDEPAPDEELAIVLPTPTPELSESPSTPTPAPPDATATPAPTEPPPTEEPASEPDPTPTETPAEADEPPPTPEPDAEARDGLVDEPEEALDGPSTDVYAFVSGEPLRENEVSSLEVKTVNGGTEGTTGLSVAVSASGGSILSMAPGRVDWTCSGTDAAWRCTGPTLEAESFSRSLMTVLPEDAELSLSVSVSHELADEEPDNNTFSAELPVEPDPLEPTDPVEPLADPVEPLEPPIDPAPPTDPVEPADPGGGGTGGTGDPADPGGGGTGGSGEPADPTDPEEPVDPPTDPAGGGTGGTTEPGDPAIPPPEGTPPDDPGAAGSGGASQPTDDAEPPLPGEQTTAAETPGSSDVPPE